MKDNTQHTVVSSEDVLRATFNTYVTTYKVDIKALAEKRHKSFDTTVNILWRQFKRNHTKHTAKTIATAKESNHRAGLIVEPKSVDWTNVKVTQFTNWYKMATQPTVQGNKVLKPKLRADLDMYADSLQDTYMYYLAHMDMIPNNATDTDYRRLVISKARHLRLDQMRRDTGKMSNGKVSKKHGTYAHVQNSYDRNGDNYIYNNSGDEPTGIKIKGTSVA